MNKSVSGASSSSSSFSDSRKPRRRKKIEKFKPTGDKVAKEKDLEPIEESSESKKYLKIINCAKRHPLKYHEYPKLKYKDHIYSVNDTVLVSNCDDAENDFVAVLRRIIKAIHQGALYIIIEVQWYYKKSDLPGKYASSLRYISENEVFLTEHHDFTNVECINGPCAIITFEQYEALPSITPNTFYSRSSYDTVKKKLTPGIEDWTKTCVCNSPINPDLLYIQCEGCAQWFHAECMGVSEEQAGNEEQFRCPNCKK